MKRLPLTDHARDDIITAAREFRSQLIANAARIQIDDDYWAISEAIDQACELADQVSGQKDVLLDEGHTMHGARAGSGSHPAKASG